VGSELKQGCHGPLNKRMLTKYTHYIHVQGKVTEVLFAQGVLAFCKVRESERERHTHRNRHRHRQRLI
jgi:hypothetical protein